MDTDSFLTPRKLLQNALARTSSRQSMTSSPSIMAVRTPRTATNNGNATSRFNLLPVLQTPPSRIFSGRVVNPFEPHLSDRLHLPMIASPSLFHRPSTPQNNNSSVCQFEWTIDEVSSLGPAHVEPHETQFLETPDPAAEARLQAAISSFFKENSIVPSPIDYNQRKQKFDLLKQSSEPNRSIVQSAKRRQRDGVAQTVLTLPPVLPPEVEAVLSKFLTFNEDQQQKNNVPTLDESSASSIDHDARDASLRRKLFNIISSDGGAEESETEGADRFSNSLDDLDLIALSPAPVSPEVLTGSQEAERALQQALKRSRYFGSQEALGDVSLSPVIESDNESSFGALSPISRNSMSPSPAKSYELHHSDLDAIYRSTPEPSACSQTDGGHYYSLQQNDTGSQQGSIRHTELTNVLAETNLSNDGETMVSCLSLELSQKSQHSMTPLRRMRRTEHRRSNRKNLSQSFMLETTCATDGDQEQPHKSGDISMCQTAKGLSPIKETPVSIPEQVELRDVNFYRTDSGFNEESQGTGDLSDVSMLSEDLRSTTPGRRGAKCEVKHSSTNYGSSPLRL
ncbi:protein aurora borealis-like [Anopheles albimanus]|uniref:protein aurora borealis-like n=1 Tax=Anopheles albimanus TaxID=7167 RepID=UPI001640EAA2|nr:protein aurora borealis-like [Anopheles albimanus]